MTVVSTAAAAFTPAQAKSRSNSAVKVQAAKPIHAKPALATEN